MARLEDYELGRVLAQGGMGVVHEAVERATGRRVALERILPQSLEPEAVARFVLEGRAVARLQHPGIVRVHALAETPGGWRSSPRASKAGASPSSRRASARLQLAAPVSEQDLPGTS